MLRRVETEGAGYSDLPALTPVAGLRPDRGLINSPNFEARHRFQRAIRREQRHVPSAVRRIQVAPVSTVPLSDPNTAVVQRT